MTNTILLRKTLRDLRASLSQTIALTVIIALGIASFVALIGAYRDLNSSYDRTYNELNFADVMFTVRALPQKELAKIARIEGIRSVTGRLVFDTGLELPQSGGSQTKEIRARLIGVPPARHPRVNDVFILKGRYLVPDDRRSALLESHFADIYHFAPGDTVQPILNGKTTKFKVVGLAASPEYLIVSASRQEIVPSASTFGVLFVPLPELQQLTGTGDVVNDIAVALKPGVNRSKAIASIERELRPYGLLSTTLRKDQPSNAALKLDVEGFREIAYLMPALILAVAIASVYMLLARQVRAQRSQIGIAKALGYGNRPIAVHYMTSAIIIGVLGSILGILGGLPFALGITTAYAKELGIPLVQTHLYPDIIAESVLVSLIVSAIAGLGPAYGAAKVAPAIAMHPDVSGTLTTGRVSFLAPLVSLPIWARLSMRSVFRVRRRAVSTGLGIIFSFVLVLVTWGMIDSMNYMLQRQFNDIERWDGVATFNAPITSGTIERIRGIDGVRRVQPFVQLPATVKAHGKQSDVLLTALPPSQTMRVLQLPRGISPSEALASGKIVLNVAIADKLNVKRGDRITVNTPFGTRYLTVSSTTKELTSSIAYVSLGQAEKWIGVDNSVFNAVYLMADPSKADQIETKLYHVPDVNGVQLKSNVERDWQTLLGLFYALLGFIFLFALAMAFALLFNAVTINAIERRREFATMRAMGTRVTTIGFLVMLENVFLWLVVLAPGLVLGWWAAMQMGALFTSDLFFFEIVIFPSSYVITAAGVLVTMMLATLPAVRRIKRLNLADETRVLT